MGLSAAALLVVAMVFLTYQGMNSVPKALASSGVVVHPSYAKDIKPIISNSCIQCHAGFDSYANTVAKVVPGNPDASSLYGHVSGKIQPQMPLGQTPLSQEQIQTIKNWIQDGAKNN